MKYLILLFVGLTLPTLAKADTYNLTVEGLVCDFCAQGIEKKLTENFKDQQIKNIKVDLEHQKVTFDANSIDEKKLQPILKKAGYTLKGVESKPSATEEVKKDSSLTVTPETKVEKK